jgi:hypothetical protein
MPHPQPSLHVPCLSASGDLEDVARVDMMLMRLGVDGKLVEQFQGSD